MPRNMSFMLTTQQVRNREKTITRRLGWWNLKAGDIVNACEKCMGLKKGEKVVVICPIRIISIRSEPLNQITQEDVVKEGFPEWTPDQFIKMFCQHNGCSPDILLNRIEFEYIEPPQ